MPAIYLLRHGQASFGAEDYDQLSELGVEQAGLLGRALKGAGVRPAAVVCGRMRRHTQTASACLGAMGLPGEWREESGFDEFDHMDVIAAHRPDLGTMEALLRHLVEEEEPRRAFQALFDQALLQWVHGEGEYRETWAAFQERVMGALERVAGSLESGDGGLVFTSGGTISAVAQRLLAFPPEHVPAFNGMLVNAGITRVASGRRGLRLASLNEHVFLPEPLFTFR